MMMDPVSQRTSWRWERAAGRPWVISSITETDGDLMDKQAKSEMGARRYKKKRLRRNGTRHRLCRQRQTMKWKTGDDLVGRGISGVARDEPPQLSQSLQPCGCGSSPLPPFPKRASQQTPRPYAREEGTSGSATQHHHRSKLGSWLRCAASSIIYPT